MNANEAMQADNADAGGKLQMLTKLMLIHVSELYPCAVHV